MIRASARPRSLPLDDLAGDVRRQLLDEERLLEHDVLDHLLEELREAGHVDALLRRVEVDGALDVGGDQLLARSRAGSGSPSTPR